MTRFIIIRHGETGHNREHIIQGQLDTKLNARGEEQAEAVARILHQREPNIDAIFSSTLSRAYRTAEFIAGDKMPVFDAPGFRERYMGELEGMSRAQAVIERNRSGRKSLLDYGESGEQLLQRLRGAWDELRDICEKKGFKTVVLVSHGGALYQFFTALRRDGYGATNKLAAAQLRGDRKIGNCSVTILDSEKRQFELYADQWVSSISRNRDEV